MSRLYGGIHYYFDLIEGNKEGIKIGKIVADRIKMRKEGLARNEY